MSSPDQYPQLPPGVAPLVAGIASEFAAIRHDAEEAGRRSPPVINFPAPDTNFVRPETAANAITFLGGWANFGSGFATGTYAKIGTRVFLDGLVSNVGGALAANSVYSIATLPVGVRPATQKLYGTWSGDAPSAARVDVRTDGTIIVITGGAIGVSGYVSICDLSFSTL